MNKKLTSWLYKAPDKDKDFYHIVMTINGEIVLDKILTAYNCTKIYDNSFKRN